MVEFVFIIIRYINNFDDFGGKMLIEYVGGVEIVFEIGRISKYNIYNVDFVVGDEVLDG